ncbi:MAG TPA: argininosuccinate lyase [Armatimonadota bacterium]|jgi:argininosuccinate lyase
MKLWGGRFLKEESSEAAAFTHSFGFDIRLARQDVLGSLAHARMLARQGILTQGEGAQLESALTQILGEVELGEAPFDPASEDIHSAVEMLLRERLGDVAGKLHTARSRNDQVVTDLRLWLKEQVAEVDRLLLGFQAVLAVRAEEHQDTILPGFTHLQHAQPVPLAHHLLAYFWMLERDRGRLADCLRRMDLCPLGSGALAGTGFPIDRHFTAEELGFSGPTLNSLDTIADRDFVVEFLGFAALLMAHLSRLAQEITLWAAPEFGFVELDDAYATGSSIMPQKKNPDVAELVRGKSGRVYGHLLGLLAVLKGLPLAYNSDLQEDKEGLFDTVDTLTGALTAFTGMIATARFRADAMERAAALGYSNATDVADFIAWQGVPFRQAHEITGRLVVACVDSGRRLEEMGTEELRAFWDGFPDGYRVPDARASAAARSSFGGTSPERVREQLSAAAALLPPDTLTDARARVNG